MAKPSGRPLRNELIEAASTLIQQVGVNSFSYGTLASEIGIASPSIHHHFAKKDDLVSEVAAQYRTHFNAHVGQISNDDHRSRLRSYGRLFNDTASKELMCLCGSIAADWLTVGERTKAEVGQFFTDQIGWITSELEAGVSDAEFDLTAPPDLVAHALMSALEGAMLLTRSGSGTNLPGSIGDALIDSMLLPPE